MMAIAGAITGKARAQSVADLSALSAARSMKRDLPRLLAPPTLPNGLPNPAHMSKLEYLARARLTATRIAVGNGASPLRVSVRFPDSLTFALLSLRSGPGYRFGPGSRAVVRASGPATGLRPGSVHRFRWVRCRRLRAVVVTAARLPKGRDMACARTWPGLSMRWSRRHAWQGWS